MGSIIGISAAITALLVILSFAQGVQDFFGERILMLAPHLTLEAGVNEEITQDLKRTILEVPGVKAVSPYVQFPALIQKGLAAEPITVKGVSWDSELELIDSAEILEAGDWRQIKLGQGAVLGVELARSLGVNVGDRVVLVSPYLSRALLVDGLFYTGYYGIDGSLVMVGLEVGQELLGTTGVTGYGVRIDDYTRADVFIGPLQDATGLWVRPWYEREQGLFISMAVQRTVLVWILVFTLLVSALGIMNVYLFRAWAQQRSVGVLRALGASPRQIGALFLIQGLASGFLGGCVGVLSARLAVWGLSHVTIRLPQIFYLEKLPIAWAHRDVWWVMAAAVLTGAAAVLLPARRMTQVDPVEVVRRAG